MASFGIFAVLLIAINALATADVCYSGQQLGGSDGDDPQWVIPHSQPCKCTRILPGGVNVAKSQQGRLVQAPLSKTAIIAADEKSEILTALGCNKQSTEPLTPTLSQSITVVSNSNGNPELVPQNLGSYCPEYDNDISHGTGQTTATIYPLGIPTGINVLCELDSDGRGWIVFQRRNYTDWESRQVFNKTFEEYKNGFGSLTGDNFWWGNDNLATVTADGTWQLRVSLRLWDATNKVEEYRYATYFPFRVTSPEYTLSISNYYPSGNLSDILSNHHGMAFSTLDRGAGSACATQTGGGWWFQNVDCDEQINLNADTPCHAIECWLKIPAVLINCEMKIRRV
ncbi:ficolin-1-A-like [Patiria miniata]|uniref:Fibrinogen C-terminal domain-containing protein n=1 Tax=Patiria miniata TaxID=46514 RepID=A0A914AMG9_PATMI|nr:ficolin-1-A-like [Patiria miniata]